MRIIAYLRVSTAMQDHGIDGQRLACQEFSRKIGTQIFDEYVDINYSGALDYLKRPALCQAIEQLKKGDILLVYKRDRLARGIDVMSAITKVVSEKKATIISTCGEGTEKEDAQARLYRNISDSFALYEKEITCERIKQSMQAMKAEGKLVGRIPFGYKLKEDGVYLDFFEEEQNVINAMKQLREEGYTIREMLSLLNSKGLLNRGQTKWTKSSLHRIISREHLPAGRLHIN